MTDKYVKSISEAYSEGARDYADYFHEPHKFLEPDRKIFLDALPQNSEILDCGCGPGQDSELFTNLGHKVTGIDLTNKFIQMAKKRVPSATFKQMDMRNMEFGSDLFDGIWVSFSLLHIKKTDVPGILNNLKLLLKPNGVVMIAIHRGEKTNWVKANISGMDKLCFVQEWKQEDFENEIIKAGLKIVQSRLFIRKGGRFPLLSIIATKESMGSK